MGVDNLNNREPEESLEQQGFPDHVRLLLKEYGDKLLDGKIKRNEFDVNVQATIDCYGEEFRDEIERRADEILGEFEKKQTVLSDEPEPLDKNASAGKIPDEQIADLFPEGKPRPISELPENLRDNILPAKSGVRKSREEAAEEVETQEQKVKEKIELAKNRIQEINQEYLSGRIQTKEEYIKALDEAKEESEDQIMRTYFLEAKLDFSKLEELKNTRIHDVKEKNKQENQEERSENKAEAAKNLIQEIDEKYLSGEIRNKDEYIKALDIAKREVEDQVARTYFLEAKLNFSKLEELKNIERSHDIKEKSDQHLESVKREVEAIKQRSNGNSNSFLKKLKSIVESEEKLLENDPSLGFEALEYIRKQIYDLRNEAGKLGQDIEEEVFREKANPDDFKEHDKKRKEREANGRIDPDLLVSDRDLAEGYARKARIEKAEEKRQKEEEKIALRLLENQIRRLEEKGKGVQDDLDYEVVKNTFDGIKDKVISEKGKQELALIEEKLGNLKEEKKPKLEAQKSREEEIAEQMKKFNEGLRGVKSEEPVKEKTKEERDKEIGEQMKKFGEGLKEEKRDEKIADQMKKYGEGLKEEIDNKSFDKNLETAAQAVAAAEIALKKAEKKQRDNKKIFRGLGDIVTRKSDASKRLRESDIDLEVNEAKAKLEEAKKKFSNLSKQFAMQDLEKEGVDKAEAKYNSVDTILKAQNLLEKTRREELEKNRPVWAKVIKNVVDKYNSLSFKQHMMIMGTTMGVAAVVGSFPAGSIALGWLITERMLSTVGGVASTEGMFNKFQKKKIDKIKTKGQEEIKEKVLEEAQQFEKVSLGDRMEFLNQAFNKAESESNKLFEELKKKEKRQNIIKWGAAGAVGLAFAFGVPEKLFRKAFDWGGDKLAKKFTPKLEGLTPEAQEKWLRNAVYKNRPPGTGYTTLKDLPVPKPPVAPAEAISKGAEKATEKITEQAAQAGKAATEQIVEKGAQTAGQAVKGGMEAAKETGKAAVNLIETARPGDSVWKMLERKAGEAFGKEWDKLDKIQRIHLTDTLKNKVLEGRSSEFLKVGEKVDLSKAFNDNKLLQNLFSKYQTGGDIVKGSAKYEHIQKVSEVIKNNISSWTSANRGPLTTSQLAQRVRDMLEGGVKGVVKTGKKAAGRIAEKQFVNESAGVLGTSTEKGAEIFPEIAKKALKSLDQKKVGNLWNFPAKNFLKSANPGHVNVEFSDVKGVENFRGMRDFASHLKDYIKPDKNEKFIDWINRARKIDKLPPLKAPKFYNLDKTIDF